MLERLGDCAGQIKEFMASESRLRQMMCAPCPRSRKLPDFAKSQFEELRRRKYELGNEQAQIFCGNWSFSAPLEKELIERDTKARDLSLVEGLRHLPKPESVDDLYDCADYLLKTKILDTLSRNDEVLAFMENLGKRVNVSALATSSRFPTQSTLLLLKLAKSKVKMENLVADFFCNLVKTIPLSGTGCMEGNGGPLADGLWNLLMKFDDYFSDCWYLFFGAQASTDESAFLKNISEKVKKECQTIIKAYQSKSDDMSICAAFVRLSLLPPSALREAVRKMLKTSADAMATAWEKKNGKDTHIKLWDNLDFLLEQFGLTRDVVAQLKWYSLRP